MKKILIVGVSASGKSTISRKLGEILNLPITFMDSVMWKPGWVYVGDEIVAERLKEISTKPEWLIEGYIVKDARVFLFKEADLIIYLDYPRIIPAWRYIKRCFIHRKDARKELEGSPEKFSFKFLRTVWMKWEAITLDEFLDKVEDKRKIVKLKSPMEVEGFINKLK